jgi:hypothetical protein
MTPTIYRDLCEFGVRFVRPGDKTFATLVREIQERPRPFGPEVPTVLGEAAVLMNESGRSIVALAYVWRYTDDDGQTRSSRHCSLGSSIQMDILTGRQPVPQDRSSTILPGSKRLIAPEGIFGDNLDVLPANLAVNSGGWLGGAGHGTTRGLKQEVIQIELQLDVVFFDDGLCVGPDEWGLFMEVRENLQRQLQAAGQVVAALREGESVGSAFEILRPLARRQQPHTGAGRSAGHHQSFLPMFARMAIDRLVNASDPEILIWFEEAARPFTVRLRRPDL